MDLLQVMLTKLLVTDKSKMVQETSLLTSLELETHGTWTPIVVLGETVNHNGLLPISPKYLNTKTTRMTVLSSSKIVISLKLSHTQT